jgi:protein dithiol oxidoreductase (disulfide-forming)
MPIRHAFLPLLALAVSLAAACGEAATPIEGTNYRTITPAQPTASPNKIEVIEFFSYGCPHCAHFYPVVNDWLKSLPKDVVFRRVPVGFDRSPWVNLERTYYALGATGELERLDGKLFDAIHEEHQQLFEEGSIADWVGKNGGNGDKFSAAYASFGVNNQVAQADKMAEQYGITSIPTMVVDGKYAALGDSFPDIIANTNALIARARAEKGAAPRAAPGK